MYFFDDYSVWLAPRGMVPQYIGQPCKRAELYKHYREFVSLFTISRRFRDETLPIFWRGNSFELLKHINLAHTADLPRWVDTAINYVGSSGKIYLQTLIVPIIFTLFVKPGKNLEYDTDLSITLRALLEMMPNLRELELDLSCSVKSEDFPGYEETQAVLCKAAERFLEFSYPLRCIETYEKPSTFKSVHGSVTARPLHAKKQETGASQGAHSRC